MTTIIPCGGAGNRFKNAGYAGPKPLIEITGIQSRRKIIEHVLDMCAPTDNVYFICPNTDIYRLYTECPRSPNYYFFEIFPHNKGPVYTVHRMLCDATSHKISDDEEIMVIYCDGTAPWDRDNFENFVHTRDLDGCLITHTGFHPHTLSSTKMAYLKTEGERVLEVREKASYTNNCMSEHASSGMYYFKKGAYVKKYFKQLLETTPGHNGEYYVTLVYNLMIQDGLKIGFYDTDHVAILGTPETVQNFEAWTTILRGDQVRNEEDLLKCYHYWKNYHNANFKACTSTTPQSVRQTKTA